MSIQAVNSTSGNKSLIKNRYSLVQVTGYGALGTGGLCLIQGMRHKKSHRALGVFSLILASLHVAIIENMHRNARKNTSLSRIA